MSAKRRSISVYHIRKFIDGVKTTSFNQAIKENADVVEYNPVQVDELDFAARLFVSTSDPKIPGWVDLLEDAFSEIEIPMTIQSNAVLLIKIMHYGDQYFAIAFGHGRYLLKPGSYDRNYGLKAALNIIYDKSGVNPNYNRLRSVDSKTVAANVLQTRRQVDRKADFETFGVDIHRDLLRAITGIPIDSDYWGTRISGRDSFTAFPEIEYESLGKYCKAINRAYRRDDYRTSFDWIDNLKIISDPELVSSLNEKLINAIKNNEQIELAVPEIVEWERLDKFRVTFDSENTFRDVGDRTLIELLNDDLKEKLHVRSLKNSWKLESLDANGELIDSWPIYKCLSGEIIENNQTYIFSEGEYFCINTDFKNELDEIIDSIKLSDHKLPDSEGDKKEGDYNEIAAGSSNSYLLLDKKTVRLSGKTSPIEICDILTDNGSFIHVKRKLGSSSLSHLFAQGSVSADLFLMSEEYRRATLDKIKEQEKSSAIDEDDNNYKGRFSTFSVSGIAPGDYEVVYAIVAKWNGRSLVQSLPFFSKVNLRRHYEDLRRMGYKVSMAKIEVV